MAAKARLSRVYSDLTIFFVKRKNKKAREKMMRKKRFELFFLSVYGIFFHLTSHFVEMTTRDEMFVHRS